MGGITIIAVLGLFVGYMLIAHGHLLFNYNRCLRTVSRPRPK